MSFVSKDFSNKITKSDIHLMLLIFAHLEHASVLVTHLNTHAHHLKHTMQHPPLAPLSQLPMAI
jgi:hypothetical protein